MDDLTTKRVFFVIGEESGDILGADLLDALNEKAGAGGLRIEAVGLAGACMEERGVSSLFDISEIAVMGFTAVLARLPKIINRVYQTVAAIEKQKPDIIVLIDSPDFTHAVARRIRKKLPQTPIIDYVCPSVWAWRQGRAKKMAAYIDHVLALLPFEPTVLKELGGPDATYVGHRLADDVGDGQGIVCAYPHEQLAGAKPVLLVLPGSRRGELNSLLEVFGETVALLEKRGHKFDCIIPAVPRLADEIKMRTANWIVKPEIVATEQEKKAAFQKATAALAVSGTVSLELAIAGVPMVLAYKLDAIARPLGFLIKTWSAALPNLVADYVVVPEEVNETASMGRLARHLERLLNDTPERQAQTLGLQKVRERMKVDQPPGQKAADIVLTFLQ